MTKADPRTHNDALVELLTTAGVVTGDATYPEAAYGWQGTPGQSQFIPYAVVYPLVQRFDGSIGCPDTDATFGWQVTCVGSTREQADWMKHEVDQALIGAQLAITGRFVPRIREDGGAGTRRDDTVQPATFIATPHYAAVSVEA